jgi:hypothetical protein
MLSHRAVHLAGRVPLYYGRPGPTTTRRLSNPQPRPNGGTYATTGGAAAGGWGYPSPTTK